MTTTTIEATAAYKRGTPLRSNSKEHQEDLAAIRGASRPLDKADRLILKRRNAKILAKLDGLLMDLQGRKKRYQYNQAVAQQLEHLQSTPLDPHTQEPLWRELLRLTKGKNIDRDTFQGFVINIFRQHDLHDRNAR